MVVGTLVAITSQGLAAWVFGTSLLIFLGVMAILGVIKKRDAIPPFAEQILALFAALLAGLFTFFITGTIAVEGKGIQAAGGLAMFALVRLGWKVRVEVTAAIEPPSQEPGPKPGESVPSLSDGQPRPEKKLKPKAKHRGLTKTSAAAVVTVVIGGLLIEATVPVIDRSREHFARDTHPAPTPGEPLVAPPQPTYSASPSVMKQPANRDSASVMEEYHPSGLMGDIGDLRPTARMEEADQFTYEPQGRGSHEYDYKYVNGILNERPAQFAGVMYLHPRGNWGTDPAGGCDLRDVADVIRWEARAVDGTVNVEFLIGGITWTWDEMAKKKVPAPYPDSLPHTDLGTKRLTSEWKLFEVDLREKGRVRDDFKKVVGGFGWVITWAANGLKMSDDALSPNQKKVFIIEIRNIRYERKQQ
ncbi:MAG: hypothetical protein NTZ17_10260 [Phycisphaerae bacterium]|nr:hypothetical protein [Phycisphaerae bacterium]